MVTDKELDELAALATASLPSTSDLVAARNALPRLIAAVREERAQNVWTKQALADIQHDAYAALRWGFDPSSVGAKLVHRAVAEIIAERDAALKERDDLRAEVERLKEKIRNNEGPWNDDGTVRRGEGT